MLNKFINKFIEILKKVIDVCLIFPLVVIVNCLGTSWLGNIIISIVAIFFIIIFQFIPLFLSDLFFDIVDIFKQLNKKLKRILKKY